jgi:hypothetical protein
MITSTTSSHHPVNSQVPLATPTSNLVVMATNVNDNSKQIINNLAREMMESTGLHTTNTASILSQSNIPNTGLIVKQEYVYRRNSITGKGEIRRELSQLPKVRLIQPITLHLFL